ncbi:MAG: alpha-amylase family glycosyl hydrolase [Sediminibacterium sp.]
MYDSQLHKRINQACVKHQLQTGGKDNLFYTRFIANTSAIGSLFRELYGNHPNNEPAFDELIQIIIKAHTERSPALALHDNVKEGKGHWFLSNEIAGMSLYIDRFCDNLGNLPGKLEYFTKLGVNFLHLMPIFQSPEGESDGGYAVSDFRKVDTRFGTLADLQLLQQQMRDKNMYLMLDIVLNHTSHRHEWAEKAKKGEVAYQDYYYMYNDRSIPDQFDQTMPDIFPESSPGNFTYVKECNKWVMTVFHHYQWDLNYTNPAVFNAMLDTIFFYANMGIDMLRIDAPAFIWKQLGTTSQNLPQAHTLLRLIKQCVQVAAPGMALLGEAIVAPKEIMKYFGTGAYAGKECDFAYNATQMALQWDALATGDIRVMLAAQQDLLQKPFGTSWITYTRCHDDIGLGYDDSMITAAGYNAYEHRKFLKDYYSGIHSWSPAMGALFSVNPKTQDARISGSLASLCGLEKALDDQDRHAIGLSIRKIILMQAQSCFIGGLPMFFYGDEVGYTNDYTFANDPAKSYDNRWMHRPVINWEKNKRIEKKGSVEERIFSATQRLISLRKKIPVIADLNNLTWLTPHNTHVAGFLRAWDDDKLYCLFNFSNKTAYVTWYAFKEHGAIPSELYDYWNEEKHTVGADHEYFAMEPYSFCILQGIIG